MSGITAQQVEQLILASIPAHASEHDVRKKHRDMMRYFEAMPTHALHVVVDEILQTFQDTIIRNRAIVESQANEEM